MESQEIRVSNETANLECPYIVKRVFDTTRLQPTFLVGFFMRLFTPAVLAVSNICYYVVILKSRVNTSKRIYVLQCFMVR